MTEDAAMPPPRRLRRAPELVPYQIDAGLRSAQVAPTPATDPPIDSPFRDGFQRGSLGSSYFATSSVWRLADGWICAERAHNHPLWLRRRIPKNASIRFLARSESHEGDLKVELWGNGMSLAHSTTYDDATGYLAIFGGWQNRLHVFARLNEHGKDRKALSIDPGSDNSLLHPVEVGRTYQFQIERRDGHAIHWLVDGQKLLEFVDDNPLFGQGHDHFAFNDWNAEVCFDDLTIVPLPD